MFRSMTIKVLSIIRKRRNLSMSSTADGPVAAVPPWAEAVVGELVNPTDVATADQASGLGRRQCWPRGGAQERTLMRHAPWFASPPIGLLAATVRLLAGCRSLIATPGRGPLLGPHPAPANFAAIALPAVTACADREHSVAEGVAAPAQPHAFNGAVLNGRG